MNATATNSSLKFNKSKIPTPKSNVRGIQQGSTPSAATEMSFDKGKSGGQLKQRLASAVSAKIAAANREGRTTNNNRGIEYLLQRKQQNDVKLNTKAISFQKPTRNSSGEARNGEQVEPKSGGNLASGTNDLRKRTSQKSLLNALMSSRVSTGTLQGNKSVVHTARPNPMTGRKAISGGRPTLGTGNRTPSPDQTSPNGTASKMDDKDSKFASLLEEIQVKRTLTSTERATSYRNGEPDKRKTSLPTKNIQNSMPKDNIGSKNLHVNGRQRGPQVAKKIAQPTKIASLNKQHLSGNENRGNIHTAALTSKDNQSSMRNAVPKNNSKVSKIHDKFQEDLLEKLEEDAGSCKIAAFQNMEDFSVLRMRAYRIRGDLEQLKRAREKRTAI